MGLAARWTPAPQLENLLLQVRGVSCKKRCTLQHLQSVKQMPPRACGEQANDRRHPRNHNAANRAFEGCKMSISRECDQALIKLKSRYTPKPSQEVLEPLQTIATSWQHPYLFRIGVISMSRFNVSWVRLVTVA